MIPDEPGGDVGRICVSADGFVPYDVTDLVRQGGVHSCVLEPAARLELAIEDLAKTHAVADVDVQLEVDGHESGSQEAVVWPTAVSPGVSRFDLRPGTYRLSVDDDSILVLRGGEPVVVTDLTPQRRTLVLAGLVAAATWSTGASVRSYSVETLPQELLAVHERQAKKAAQRLLARLGPETQLWFAATRSLVHRHTVHDATLRLGGGDGTTTLHSVAFQPLDQVSPQAIRIDPPPDAGRLRVCCVGPSGARVDGIAVRVFEAGRAERGVPLAVLRSGDDWRTMARGTYELRADLPARVLVDGAAVEAVVMAGEPTDRVIRLSKDLIGADLRIEVEGGAVPRGASVRIGGDGGGAVYHSSKPDRIRVWVPPKTLEVEVYVSEELQTVVEIDFGAAGPHTVRVTGN